MYITFVPETRTERRHLEHPGIEGWITLKHIFKKHDVGQGLDSSCLQQRHVAGKSKRGEALALIKCAVCSLHNELLASQEGNYSTNLCKTNLIHSLQKYIDRNGEQNIKSTPCSYAISWLPIKGYLVSFSLYY